MSHKAEKQTIGLFGTYWMRNFGDDLMGLLFAKLLSDAGFNILAYGMNAYNGAFGIRSMNSLSEMVSQSDYVVLGGGGYLVPRPVVAGYQFHTQMERASHELAELLVEKKTPFYVLSIGGVGKGVNPDQLPAGWQALLSNAKLITVRNKDDLPLASEFCSRSFCFPDIVWLTPVIVGIVSKSLGKKGGLVIHIGRGSSENLRGFRKILNKRPLWMGRSVLPLLARTWYKRKTLISYAVPQDRKGRAFENILRMINWLSSCDATISPGLHVGLAAMSFGNAFVSYRGPKKAKVFMEENGIDGFCGDSIEKVMSRLDDPIMLGRCRLTPDRLLAYQRQARGHVECFLDDIGHQPKT